MWLILSVVLIIIFGGLKTAYSIKDLSYNSEKKRRDEEHDWFISSYTDKTLENNIRNYINDESNFENVCCEVHKAFLEMPHWSNVKFRFPAEIYNSRLVLDIMLANRGKLSESSAIFGITNPWGGSTKYIDRLKSYELVEWIQNTLVTQKVYVTPILIGELKGHSTYYWKGTRTEIINRETSGYHEFSKELLEAPSNIPPPYYNNK